MSLRKTLYSLLSTGSTQEDKKTSQHDYNLGHKASTQTNKIQPGSAGLGPSINGLVTDGNTKLFCQGFLLALFQSTTAYKIDS